MYISIVKNKYFIYIKYIYIYPMDPITLSDDDWGV